MTEEPNFTDIIEEDRRWAALIYFFTPLVPVFTLLQEDKKNNSYFKIHNTQALIWGILFYLVVIVTTFGLIGVCIFGIGIMMNIFWGLKAYRGEIVEIPIISKIVRKI